jgi:hypothetical protein
VVQRDPTIRPHAHDVAGPSRVVAEVLPVAEELVVGDRFEWLFEAVLFFDPERFAQCSVINETGVPDKHATADLIAPILITANIVRLAIE